MNKRASLIPTPRQGQGQVGDEPAGRPRGRTTGRSGWPSQSPGVRDNRPARRPGDADRDEEGRAMVGRRVGAMSVVLAIAWAGAASGQVAERDVVIRGPR